MIVTGYVVGNKLLACDLTLLYFLFGYHRHCSAIPQFIVILNSLIDYVPILRLFLKEIVPFSAVHYRQNDVDSSQNTGVNVSHQTLADLHFVSGENESQSKEDPSTGKET